MIKCNRCGNEDIKYFYDDHGTWYCRRCIAFGRINVDDPVPFVSYHKLRHHCDYKLRYPLTSSQNKAQLEIAYHLKLGYDVLVYAACGAGKTELVMDSIKTYLNDGKKVGFAISRRQVVLEIKDRMQEAFETLHVIAVCEGYTDIVDGDLIICTMHQLYRYHNTFDLLIMDEVDAFPYRGNTLLQAIAENSCIGQKIFLTATPDEDMLQKVKENTYKMVELFMRPHGYPLIVPEVKAVLNWMQYCILIRYLYKNKKHKYQALVFVPTIALAQMLTQYLKLLFKTIAITSKTTTKDEIIELFHKRKYDFLISTTILERGITIKGINVVILHADHPVFNEASLIQMIGRVGRNIEQPTGNGLFLCKKTTEEIKRCVNAITKMNKQEDSMTRKLVKV